MNRLWSVRIPIEDCKHQTGRSTKDSKFLSSSRDQDHFEWAIARRIVDLHNQYCSLYALQQAPPSHTQDRSNQARSSGLLEEVMITSVTLIIRLIHWLISNQHENKEQAI